MTFTELQERCKNRNFDRIVVVVKDIFQELADMCRILHEVPGDVRVCTEQTDPGLRNEAGELAFTERRALFRYENTQICVVQPVAGETVYQTYLDRFGEGICCVRERIAADAYDGAIARFESKNLKIAQRRESDSCRTAWVDLRDELGILFEVISDDSREDLPAQVIPRRIAQVNITTPDVRKTIGLLTDYLEIGPWEVGSQNNHTVHDTGFLVDGRLEDIEFEFLLAILVCGNIEWEVIEPVRGQLVYNDFIRRRGVGFHHVLREIPKDQWQAQIAGLEEHVPMASKGSIGPIDWCYMNTEDDLHFYTELRTDAVMEQLPDGYFQYYYPEQD